MKLILVSHPAMIEKELELLSQMDEHLIDGFHLRKPSWCISEMENYLHKLPLQISAKTVLHSNYELVSDFPVKGIHLTETSRAAFENGQLSLPHNRTPVSTSFHSIFQLISCKTGYDYVFLSPVFDSISKSGYRAAFKPGHLEVILPKVSQKVVALGGVDRYNVRACQKLGFSGVAVLGAVWLSQNPLESLLTISKFLNQS